MSLLSEITYEGLLAHLPLCPCKILLSTFSGEPIPVLEKVVVNVEYEQQAARVPPVIVKSRKQVMLLIQKWQ